LEIYKTYGFVVPEQNIEVETIKQIGLFPVRINLKDSTILMKVKVNSLQK